MRSGLSSADVSASVFFRTETSLGLANVKSRELESFQSLAPQPMIGLRSGVSNRSLFRLFQDFNVGEPWKILIALILKT